MGLKYPAGYPGAHWYGKEEERAVRDVIRKATPFRYYGLARPIYVDAFEAAARKFYGMKYAMAVNSGTGALMTAMTALGIGPGAEVIVPAFFWVSTVGAVVSANAIPVLCDIDDSFTMDPGDLERKITPRTKLIIPVHMAGAVCDMGRIMAIADRRGIPVMEDCAQCNGGSFRRRKVGTFGVLGMYSLQLNKNITAGEGGLLVTNEEKLYLRAAAAHDVGVPWEGGGPRALGPESTTWGSGRRMSELIGAVASVQIRKLPRIVRAMRDSKRRIRRMLEGTAGLRIQRFNDEKGETSCFLMFTVRDAAFAREVVQRMWHAGLRGLSRLADYGMHVYYNVPQLVDKVPLSPSGNPWTLPENARSVYDYRKGACPVADDLFERSIVLSIPSCLTPAQEKATARILRAAVTAP